ncbi:MAG: hypothetical protein DRJ03_24835 [Chloroflexi bacterium]|nr:MAG: hypothetical protein DRJ03_24835 [Chloroflexota bacterium]
MKSDQRSLPCPACFGQGMTFYTADSTGTHLDSFSKRSYIIDWEEDIFPYFVKYFGLEEEEEVPCPLEEDLQVPIQTYCTKDPQKKVFVREALCRVCGGTGQAFLDAWYVGMRFECEFDAFVYEYDKKLRLHPESDTLDYYELECWRDAAILAYEMPKLVRKVNILHRRAQRAEGQLDTWKHKYEKERARNERLLDSFDKKYGINRKKALRSRIAQTARLVRQKRAKEQEKT